MATCIRYRNQARNALLYVILAVVLLGLLFPLYWMAITSLKTPEEAFRMPPTFWPQRPTLTAYPFMFKAWGYWRTLANTIVIAGLSALGATLLGGMAAYGFSRLEFPGKSLLYGSMVVTMALPAMVTVGPIFLAYRRLDLLDTRLGLVLVLVSGGLPLAMLVIFSQLNSIPRDLDDAAAIDGCSWFDTLFRVILPIATSSATISFLLLFIGYWNEFLFPFILSVTPATRVLTVRLFEVPYRGAVNVIAYDLIATGGMLVLLPIVPVLIVGQSRLVEGILAGALQGT